MFKEIDVSFCQNLITFAKDYAKIAIQNDVDNEKPNNSNMKTLYDEYKQLTDEAVKIIDNNDRKKESVFIVCKALHARKRYVTKFFEQKQWNKTHVFVFEKMANYLDEYIKFLDENRVEKAKEDNDLHYGIYSHFDKLEMSVENDIVCSKRSIKLKSESEIYQQKKNSLYGWLSSYFTNKISTIKLSHAFFYVCKNLLELGIWFGSSDEYISILKIPFLLSFDHNKVEEFVKGDDTKNFPILSSFVVNLVKIKYPTLDCNASENSQIKDWFLNLIILWEKFEERYNNRVYLAKISGDLLFIAKLCFVNYDLFIWVFLTRFVLQEEFEHAIYENLQLFNRKDSSRVMNVIFYPLFKIDPNIILELIDNPIISVFDFLFLPNNITQSCFNVKWYKQIISVEIPLLFYNVNHYICTDGVKKLDAGELLHYSYLSNQTQKFVGNGFRTISILIKRYKFISYIFNGFTNEKIDSVLENLLVEVLYDILNISIDKFPGFNSIIQQSCIYLLENLNQDKKDDKYKISKLFVTIMNNWDELFLIKGDKIFNIYETSKSGKKNIITLTDFIMYCKTETFLFSCWYVNYLSNIGTTDMTKDISLLKTTNVFNNLESSMIIYRTVLQLKLEATDKLKQKFFSTIFNKDAFHIETLDESKFTDPARNVLTKFQNKCEKNNMEHIFKNFINLLTNVNS